jgi:hypothetical protein
MAGRRPAPRFLLNLAEELIRRACRILRIQADESTL